MKSNEPSRRRARRPLLVAVVGAGTLLIQGCIGVVGNLMGNPGGSGGGGFGGNGGSDDMSAVVDMATDMGSPADLKEHD
jgi:hypothetical protein